ncbi:MAG: hypothetical protein CMH83_19835 [Nocardioides sp.]|nr:hypothetical protein [Nocardioides sp.]
MHRIAIATAAEVSTLDDEGRHLLAALVDAGLEVEPAVWDDADVDWSSYDAVVVRSTWDYPRRLTEFLDWAARVAERTLLLNDVALLTWTTDKRYLLDLERAGVPVVPSVFLEPGQPTEHPLLGLEHVVKPTVSAGSIDTLRLGPDDPDRSRGLVEAIHATGRTAMVQPYLADVDVSGETALVYLDGVLSHAMRKGALLEAGAELHDGLYAQEQIDPRDATPEEAAVGEAALAAVAALPERAGALPPLYARVDLLGSPEGPVVLEVELAEPSLFLDLAPGSAQRFAEAVRRRLG